MALFLGFQEKYKRDVWVPLQKKPENIGWRSGTLFFPQNKRGNIIIWTATCEEDSSV